MLEKRKRRETRRLRRHERRANLAIAKFGHCVTKIAKKMGYLEGRLVEHIRDIRFARDVFLIRRSFQRASWNRATAAILPILQTRPVHPVHLIHPILMIALLFLSPLAILPVPPWSRAPALPAAITAAPKVSHLAQVVPKPALTQTVNVQVHVPASITPIPLNILSSPRALTELLYHFIYLFLKVDVLFLQFV